MKDVIIDYLEAMNLRVSHSYIEKQLLSHPDYPSLLSVSDLFLRLGVPTHIGKISEKHISKIELPFMIHHDSSRNGFLLIENKDDLSKNEFDFTSWEGIVLKAEP